MRKWNRCRVVVGIALLTLLLTGCGQKKEYHEEEVYVVGAVTKSGSSEYWMSVRLGMEAAAENRGMDLIFLTPDNEFDEKAQYKMAETLLKRDVDVLAVSPIDSYDQPEYFSVAEERRIPIVSYDTAFQDEEIPYVGIDNEKAGYELAVYLAEQMDYTGEVGIVAGDLRQSCHRLRMEGFLRYMGEQKNMKVDFVESGYSNSMVPQEKIQELKEAFPGMKGMLVTSASTAMGVLEELGDDDVKVVTVDSQEDTLIAVDKGRLSGMAAQSGYEIGYETIEYIEKMRRKEKMKSQKILPAEIVTRGNLEKYRKKIQEGQ